MQLFDAWPVFEYPNCLSEEESQRRLRIAWCTGQISMLERLSLTFFVPCRRCFACRSSRVGETFVPQGLGTTTAFGKPILALCAVVGPQAIGNSSLTTFGHRAGSMRRSRLVCCQLGGNMCIPCNLPLTSFGPLLLQKLTSFHPICCTCRPKCPAGSVHPAYSYSHS